MLSSQQCGVATASLHCSNSCITSRAVLLQHAVKRHARNVEMQATRQNGLTNPHTDDSSSARQYKQPAAVTAHDNARDSGSSSRGRGRGRMYSSSSSERFNSSSSSSSRETFNSSSSSSSSRERFNSSSSREHFNSRGRGRPNNTSANSRSIGLQPEQPRGQQQQQQQQPVLLFQGSSSSTDQATTADVSGLLTAKISSSKDLHELAQVLALHDGLLNPVHLSAVVSRAAKLYPGQMTQRQQQQGQQQQQQQLQQLVDHALRQFLLQLADASFVEASCVIGGLARLGYNDVTNDVTNACLDVTRHGMAAADVDNKVLVQLAWGLARLGLKPDEDWLMKFERATLARMHTLNNVETANALWVFAKWDVKPSELWLNAWLSHLPSQLLLLQPPELCSIVWAAAMLQLQLPAGILDSILLEAQVKFGAFTGQGFGTMAWALARMDVKPKRLWLQDFVRHSGSLLPSLSSASRDQAFTNIIWALGCWEHQPPVTWLQEFCRCVVPQLPRMPCQGLVIVAVGLAELNHRPPQPFTSYLLELFHKQLAAATAAQAAALIWALPRLLLPQTHSQAMAAAASAELPQPLPAAAAAAAAAAAVPGGWLRQYCWLLQDIADHILCGLDKLSVTELTDCVAGFADLGFFPGAPWMDAHELNLNRHLDQMTAIQINIVKEAYVTLEQQQLLQQRLYHPEQLQLLQQQRAAAAAAPRSGDLWRSSSSSTLADSAAAAAAATGAAGLVRNNTAVGGDIASVPASHVQTDSSSSSSSGNDLSSGRSSRNRRFDPPPWASSSSSRVSNRQQQQQRGRGRGKGSFRGRGRSSRGGWDDSFNDDYSEKLEGETSDKAIWDDLGVADQPSGVPKIQNKPRAVRIRLQKIREAEKEQRLQEREEWQQRWQRQPQRGQQRWRPAKPGEFN